MIDEVFDLKMNILQIHECFSLCKLTNMLTQLYLSFNLFLGFSSPFLLFRLGTLDPAGKNSSRGPLGYHSSHPEASKEQHVKEGGLVELEGPSGS